MPEAALERDIVHDDENLRHCTRPGQICIREFCIACSGYHFTTQNGSSRRNIRALATFLSGTPIRPTSNFSLHLCRQDDRNSARRSPSGAGRLLTVARSGCSSRRFRSVSARIRPFPTGYSLSAQDGVNASTEAAHNRLMEKLWFARNFT